MTRIGLMGCGTVAQYGHLPAILATPGLRLAAIYDPNEATLRRVQAAFGNPAAFTDQDAFLAAGLDAVSIASPAPCHRENVLAAARCRLPILCEKPLAMSEAECREMIAAAAAAGVLLCTAFDYRFSPVSLRLHRLVREGAIGRLRTLRLVYNWNCHGKYVKAADGARIESPRRQGRMLEGGPLVDCGVHQIDLARFWTGSEVVRTAGHGSWADDYEAPDHVWLHMDHADGAHTMVEISYSYAHTAAEPVNVFLYELIGTDGIVRYDRNLKLFELRNRAGTDVLPFAPEKNFQGMYEAFATAVGSGDPGPLPSGLDGLIAARISREATDDIIRSRLA